jgi:hypothetical protein
VSATCRAESRANPEKERSLLSASAERINAQHMTTKVDKLERSFTLPADEIT